MGSLPFGMLFATIVFVIVVGAFLISLWRANGNHFTKRNKHNF